MTIKRKIVEKGWWQITITPDEIAQELIRDSKHGAASGSIYRLAQQRARRIYKRSFEAQKPYFLDVKILRTKDMPLSSWGDSPEVIMRDWIMQNPEIKGFRFSFSSAYADLPPVIGLLRPTKPSRRLGVMQRQPRITPRTPSLRR